jgi:uncharacterized SAM-binding protein YcdF (DUF218 family)
MARRGPIRRLWSLLQFLVLLAIIWAAGYAWFALGVQKQAVEPASAQGIAVLTGGRDRLEAGMALLRDGSGQRLLISGVNPGLDDESLKDVLGLSEADKDPNGKSLFDCCIDVGRQAPDTQGNAREVAAWVTKQGFNTVIMVTASYHMPRALVEAERVAPGLDIKAYPVYPDHIRLEEWWAFGGSARLLAAEYNKYLVSYARLQLTRLLET